MLGHVTSVFRSISGEAGYRPQGSPMVFIRLFGCNLSCRYCDTKYAREPSKNYKEMSPEEVLEEVVRKIEPSDHILFTGGEPLLQKDFVRPPKRLCPSMYKNY